MDPFLFILALTSQPPSGTSIKLYGRHRSFDSSNSTDDNNFILDDVRIVLNNMTLGDQILPLYSSSNMEDGDHQLRWLPDSGPVTPIEIAYFECVVPLLHSVPRTVC